MVNPVPFNGPGYYRVDALTGQLVFITDSQPIFAQYLLDTWGEEVIYSVIADAEYNRKDPYDIISDMAYVSKKSYETGEPFVLILLDYFLDGWNSYQFYIDDTEYLSSMNGRVFDAYDDSMFSSNRKAKKRRGF